MSSTGTASAAEIRRVLSTWEGYIAKNAQRLAAEIHRYDLADDLAQEARVKVWLVTSEGGEPHERYLKSVIWNAYKSTLRRENVQPTTWHSDASPLPEEVKGPSEPMRVPLRRQSWWRALSMVVKQVFRLIYELGLTQRETAKALSLSQPRVAVYHQRLLAAARVALAV